MWKRWGFIRKMKGTFSFYLTTGCQGSHRTVCRRCHQLMNLFGAAVPCRVDARVIGLHGLIHQDAPAHFDAAVLQKPDVHPHADAHRDSIRSKAPAVLHDSGQPAALLLNMIKHLAAGNLDTLGLQILLDAAG